MGMTRHARALLVSGIAAAIGLVAAAPGHVAAGGWAVSTLDAAPDLRAGEPASIAFTIRQHGVSPVDLDDVAVTVTDSAGLTTRFEALAAGAIGHYIAVVELPASGNYTWAIEQGWFGPQDLGTLTVSGQSAASSADRRFDAPVRWALPVLAAVFGVLAIGDVAARRRRPVPA
jgi:hypothetical protein